MFYDGEPETRTSLLTGTTFVNAVESLEEAWKLLLPDTLSVIFEPYATYILIIFEQ